MLLTGDLQRQIYAAFRGKLLKGVIRRANPTVATDALGDAVPAGFTSTPCQGFTDNYSDQFKAAAGIPQASLKVMIFGGSIPGITPGKDDMVMLKGINGTAWYQLRGPVKTDPATALWECQALPASAP